MKFVDPSCTRLLLSTDVVGMNERERRSRKYMNEKFVLHPCPSEP
jgi:hypothetical protein